MTYRPSPLRLPCRPSTALVTSLAGLALVPALAWAQPAPPPPASAPPPAATRDVTGPTITIILTSGETLRGTFLGVTQDAIRIQHPVLGEIRVPRTGIARTEPSLQSMVSPPAQLTPPTITPPKPAPPAPGQASPAGTTPPTPPKPARPTNPFEALFVEDDAPFWNGWKRTVELGINGSTGARDGQNARIILNSHRSTTKMTTHVTASYAYGTHNGRTTQDRGEASIRNDWNLSETSWTFWGSGRGEMDTLQPWDGRVTASTGVGYIFEKSEKWDIIGRLGVGARYDFDGSHDIVPEVGIVNLSADYRFSKRTSAYANFEYFPDTWNSEFRSILRAGLQTVLDEVNKVNLRLGMEHRYDSTAPGERNNTLDYFAVIGFAF